MPTRSDDLTLARFPSGLTVDLFNALGSLVSAALSGAGQLMLGAGDGYDSVAKLSYRGDLSQSQVAEALRAATEQIDPNAVLERASAVAADDDEQAVHVGPIRREDEGLSFGLSGFGTEGYARQIALNLVNAMVPVMEAGGGGNYLAFEVHEPDDRSRRWELVVRRPNGRTPHEKQARYEQALREIADAALSPAGQYEAKAAARAALDDVGAPREVAS